MSKSMRSAVLSGLGAIIGAGFASGREVMTFFSRYGKASWALALLSLAATVTFACALMRGGGRLEAALGVGERELEDAGAGENAESTDGARTRGSVPRRKRLLPALFCVLYATIGGAMLASSGELFALTVPLADAGLIGYLCTLALAVPLCARGLRPLAAASLALLPLTALSSLLALNAAGSAAGSVADAGALLGAAPDTGWSLLRGAVSAVLYAALNVTLSAGVLCESARTLDGRGVCRAAAALGCAVGALLLTQNAALVRAPALADAPLPVVTLLRGYGKAGFYLAAAGLYAAVFTTLLSMLRSLRCLLETRLSKRTALGAAALLCALTGLAGFQRLVDGVYPVLGLLCVCALGAALWRRG